MNKTESGDLVVVFNLYPIEYNTMTRYLMLKQTFYYSFLEIHSDSKFDAHKTSNKMLRQAKKAWKIMQYSWNIPHVGRLIGNS